MSNAPQTINDLEYNKFLEIAGKVGIRVMITHGDGWKVPVATIGDLPTAGNTIGDIRVALDTRIPYVWDGANWSIWSWASTAWGGISGTLANQTDLQTALNGKMSNGAYVLVSRDSLLSNQVNLGSLTTGMLKVTTASGIATFSTVNPANWDTAYTHSTLTNNPHSVTKAQVGLGNVDNTSDVNKPVSTAQAAADTTVLNSAKAYADSLVVGLVDDRGNYDASGNAFPSTGGSGSAGAVLKGDLWTVSVAGTLGGKAVTPGDLIRALVDSPGQTSTNWAQTENNIGYVAENQANKGTTITGNETSNIIYPTVKAVYDWANPLIAARALDSAVVHTSGGENVGGLKNFTSGIASTEVLISGGSGVANAGYGRLLLADRVAGSIVIQAGGSGTGRVLELIDNGWTKVPVSLSFDAPSNSIILSSSGYTGLGITPQERLTVSGRIVVGNAYQSNKKYFVVEDGGASQAGASFSMYGYSRTDNTSFRVAQFVDRDGAIVGVDKYMMYMYPQDASGNPVDYMNVFGITANRGNGTTTVEFPRTTDFIVGSQNWMNTWTSYTPTVSGAGGGSGTVTINNCRYKQIGKIVIYEGQIGISDKGTLSGNIQISLPVATLNLSREFIKADSSFIGAVGAAYGTQNRVLGIQGNVSTTNMVVATNFAQSFAQWSAMTNGEYFTWRIIYEAA